MIEDDRSLRKWLDFVETAVRRRCPPPFSDQWRTFETLSSEHPSGLGPLPAWIPNPTTTARSNIAQLAETTTCATFEDLHRWSVDNRSHFWSIVIDRLGIPFETPPSQDLLASDQPTDPRWLHPATLDITAACFTAEPESLAIVSSSEDHPKLRTLTFSQLEAMVDRVAHGVRALRLDPGAGVALYMPMTPECVAAYLGVIRAGHPVVSIADSFAADEVAKRLRLGRAEVIVTVDSYLRGSRTIDLYSKIKRADSPKAIVIPRDGNSSFTLRPHDVLWDDFLGPDTPFPGSIRTPEAITNILFSSGTTGDPKAIPWTQLTPIKCAMDGHYHQDIHAGDTIAWPTNIGWMMGPWLIFAALINRATIALYEGLPSGVGFAQFIEDAGVTMLGVVPSLVRSWRESGACTSVDWNGIRVFSSTGEPSTREDSLWLMSLTGYRAPIIEYCGGTEIGGGYITGTVVQPCAPATFTTPALGLDFFALGDDSRPVEVGRDGEVFLVPPSIGLSQHLLNKDHEEVYHNGCPPGPNGELLRRHGDQLQRLPGGFWRAQGRADDTMNLGGIKVSSKELERVIETHPAVFEAAAVAVQPSGEGAERLVVFVRLADKDTANDLKAQLQQDISTQLNPLFRIEDLILSDDLPRTASGKLMRRVLRDRYLVGLAGR